MWKLEDNNLQVQVLSFCCVGCRDLRQLRASGNKSLTLSHLTSPSTLLF
ncbi:rCG62126 [Rattus norvegicus]|uniref:RCG62126 n=1 Tax=Rattus norvegicus TaxID=10116 RepID=A6HCH5_RAT|nr:rCG62126 [Rattus norvegicus]